MTLQVEEDLCFDVVVYDTYQVFIPKHIRDKMEIKPEMKLKLAVVSVIKETRKEISPKIKNITEVEKK